MSLYRDENLTMPIEVDDSVEVPDFIYVLVQLEIASPNNRFFVQVKMIVTIINRVDY